MFFMKKVFVVFFVISALWAYAQDEEMDYNDDFDYAQVQFVEARQTGGGNWTFSVTVRHADEGWDHYCDRWEVVDPETKELIARRELLHPHVNEQPFTRSKSGITIPEGMDRVLIRAACTLHGFDGKQVLVDLTKKKGENFNVSR